MLRHLDLFSGIGGFALGLERTGKFRTVAFCEIEPYCRKVLHKHWPDVPIYDDVRTLHAQRGSCDLITGGFPCQPVSGASRGRRRGSTDDRWLWPEMLRLITESRPFFVLAENVAHLDGMGLEQVVSDLEAIRYEVWTLEIPACAVGHDHWRRRLWILGHAYGNGQSSVSVDAEVAGLSGSRSDAGSMGAAHGIPGKLDGHRLRALGNAIVPYIAQLIGEAIAP